MKFAQYFLRLSLFAMCLGALSTLAATNVAPGKTNAPAGGTNAPVEVPIPISSFAMPGEGKLGKDPFYPRSGRITAILAPPKTGNTRPVAPVAVLKLSGVSGTKQRPLAVINGQTFGPGDEFSVVVAGGGKVRVTCIEVRPEDKVAIVEVGGERKELRMSSK